jgi:hypothetical protein
MRCRAIAHDGPRRRSINTSNANTSNASANNDCCPRAVEVTNRSSSGLNDHDSASSDLDGCRFNLGYAVRSTRRHENEP